MRRLSLGALLLGWFLFASFVFAQSFVQAATNTTSNSAKLSVSSSSNTNAGDLLLIGVDFPSSATFVSITDSQGNAFQGIGTPLTTPSGTSTRLYYAKNIKGGADTVTVNLSGTSSFIELYLLEYSGLDQIAPIDSQVGASGGSGTVSSGSATTSAAGDLLFGFCISDSACTAGPGFTLRSGFQGNAVEDMIAGNPGAYAATGSSNSGWTMQMVALKTAASAPPPTSGPTNGCDLATPYGPIDSTDVQSAINMSLGISPCTANLIGPNICNVVVVQRVVNAALPGGTCVIGGMHSVSLTWIASSTPNVTYNIYRTTTSGVYSPTPLASSSPALSYADTTVQSGQTYYYTVTAVSGGVESPRSNESTAVIPVP